MILDEEFRDGLRTLLREKGEVVELDKRAQAEWPDSPTMWVSPYGWRDSQATAHIRKCGLIIPDGAEVHEVKFSEFQDSFSDNLETVGINGYGGPKGSSTELYCPCNKYRGLVVRWEGSLYDALQSVLGLDRKSFTF